jgi:nitrate/TMAO reductase-like tetraheme cytochrome c subunit
MERERTTHAGIWQRLTRPSTRWSVLALLVIGVVVGFAATVGTQVMVAVTGTDRFCGTACHSMQWVAKEHPAELPGTAVVQSQGGHQGRDW